MKIIVSAWFLTYFRWQRSWLLTYVSMYTSRIYLAIQKWTITCPPLVANVPSVRMQNCSQQSTKMEQKQFSLTFLSLGIIPLMVNLFWKMLCRQSNHNRMLDSLLYQPLDPGKISNTLRLRKSCSCLWHMVFSIYILTLNLTLFFSVSQNRSMINPFSQYNIIHTGNLWNCSLI